MASAIASPIPLSPPPVAAAPTPNNQQGSGDPLFTTLFNAAVANATGQTTQTTTGNDFVGLPLADPDNSTATDATDSLAGSLLPGVAPVLVPTQPLPDAVPAVSTAVPGSTTDLSRVAELRLQFAGGPATNRSTLVGPAVAAEAQPAATAATPAQQTATPVATNLADALPTLPATTATPPATPVVTNTARIVPAQAPVVTNLIPPLIADAARATAPTPAQAAADAVVPVTEAPATAPATAITDTEFGDRPVMAGERFAALAEAGARLRVTAPRASASFSAVLNQTVVDEPVVAPAVPATGTGAALTGAPVTPTTPGSALDLLTRLTAESEAIGRAAAPAIDPRPEAFADDPRSDAWSTGVNPFAPLPASLALSAPTTFASTSAPAPAPTPAAQLAENIVAHTHMLERNGSVEFRMRLDPPHLGPIRVSLVSNGDELRGHVVVADDAVRRMIESQLPELRQRLEAVGVNVQNFDITADANSDGNRNPYSENAPTFSVPTTDASTAPAVRPAPAARTHTGSLDVTV